MPQHLPKALRTCAALLFAVWLAAPAAAQESEAKAAPALESYTESIPGSRVSFDMIAIPGGRSLDTAGTTHITVRVTHRRRERAERVAAKVDGPTEVTYRSRGRGGDIADMAKQVRTVDPQLVYAMDLAKTCGFEKLGILHQN